MAGAGKKTFVNGDVLTASQVNTYLMEQTVMVFASATARTTAIPTPSEGMVTMLQDTNAIEMYDGTSWYSVNLANSSFPNQVAVKSAADSIVRPLPFAIHAGTTASITGSATVSFPTSTRFTQAPIVVATCQSTTAVTSVTTASNTTSGFNIYFWAGGTAATLARTAQYTAVQMTSAAAQG